MDQNNLDSNFNTFLKEQVSTLNSFYDPKNSKYIPFDFHGWLCGEFIHKPICKEEHDINADIQILDQMFKSIIDCENNPSNIKQTLITIGNLAGSISFNDLGDKETKYIRNLYGYIKRNKNKLINENGIYFERLYHLKIILSNDETCSSIPQEEIDELQIHLSRLKQKIAHILSKRKSSIYYQDLTNDIDIEFSVSISGLIDFSKKYYQPVILQRLNDELNQLEIIDFSNKDDRYYFARVFCILGELFNEWLEDRSQKQNQDLIETFKHFVKLRDQIIHNHGKVKTGIGNENQSINEMIVAIKNHLKQVIVYNRNCVGNFEINYSYVDANQFHEVMNQLLNKFTRKSRSAKTEIENSTKPNKLEKPDTNSNIKNKLNRLLSRACNVIEGTTSDVKIKTKGKTCIVSIEDQLQSLNNQYQQNLEILEMNDRPDYPPDLSNKDIIKKFCENMISKPTQASDPNKKLDDKFNPKIQTLMEEINYFVSLKITSYTMNELPRKRKYIVQQVMLVIGQLSRDIENIAICKQSNTEHLSNFSSIKSFSSSSLISEGKIASKQLRNRGLAHNILGFEEDKFFESLREIEAISTQFQWFHDVLMMGKIPSFDSLMNFVVRSFIKLGMYDEAIEYIEKALDQLEDFTSKFDQEISAEFNDEYKMIFQMDYMRYELYMNLIASYVFSENFVKAFDICNHVWRQINLDHIDSISERTLEEICNINILMSYILNERGQTTVNIEIFEKIESTSSNFFVKILLIYSYLHNGRYSKAYELSKKLVEYPMDCAKKYQVIFLYANSCSHYLNDENMKGEIQYCIDKLEILLEKQLCQLKSSFGDGYLVVKMFLISLKLTLIHHNLFDMKEFQFDELKDLSNQFKKINKINFPTREETAIYTICFQFSHLFYAAYQNNFCVDLNRDILMEAQYYFDLCASTIENCPSMLTHIKVNLRQFGNALSETQKYFVMAYERLSTKEKIEYLLEILSLEEKHKLNKFFVLYSLGLQFFALGSEYLDKRDLVYQQDNADNALEYYKKSTKYYTLSLKCGQIETDAPKDLIEKVIHNTKIKLAFCYTSTSELECDLKLIVDCLVYCDELLSLPLPGVGIDRIKTLRLSNKKYLSLIMRLLYYILNSNTGYIEMKIIHPLFAPYLRKRFDIEIISENDRTKWVYRGILSLNELKNQIKEEMKYGSNEFLLLYKFYLVLQFNGILDKNKSRET